MFLNNGYKKEDEKSIARQRCKKKENTRPPPFTFFFITKRACMACIYASIHKSKTLQLAFFIYFYYFENESIYLLANEHKGM